MIINILAIVFPVLLFVFKYILPFLAQAAMSEQEINFTEIIEEILQFPLDLMFIAISYNIPKVINALTLEEELEQKSALIRYCTISLFMLLVLPFFVFLAKLAIKMHYKRNMCGRNIIEVCLYVISVACIILSLFVI